MSKISFTKMSGAGNDFIIIDKSLNTEFVLTKNEIGSLCDRHKGIGADGVILIEDSEECNFSMVYFNSDGSTGTLCANGARCAIKYAANSGRFSGNSTNFFSNELKYSGSFLEDGLVRFNLQNLQIVNKKVLIDIFNHQIPAVYSDTGSPHVVLDISELKSIFANVKAFATGLYNFPVVKFGREIRYDSQFLPGGTNVNFLEVVDDKIHIRTYERGVEDETLACGTGAVACALAANIKYRFAPPVDLITRGSDILKVDFNINENGPENVSLTGPAVEVFKGEISIN